MPTINIEDEVQHLIEDADAVGTITTEWGYYPGSMDLKSPYEGVLQEAASLAAERGLFVHLNRDGQVFGDVGEFSVTISATDTYGDHFYWVTGEVSF